MPEFHSATTLLLGISVLTLVKIMEIQSAETKKFLVIFIAGQLFKKFEILHISKKVLEEIGGYKRYGIIFSFSWRNISTPKLLSEQCYTIFVCLVELYKKTCMRRIPNPIQNRIIKLLNQIWTALSYRPYSPALSCP